MRRVCFSLALALGLTITNVCAAGSGAQAAPAPQTARQALMEMFFSKTPGTLVQHLRRHTRRFGEGWSTDETAGVFGDGESTPVPGTAFRDI
jgi:hypothetical protein